jgi:hypothetical protein
MRLVLCAALLVSTIGKLALKALPKTTIDSSASDLLAKVTKNALDAAAGKRAELVASGSGPKERTSGGAVLARAWKAAWANHLTIDGPILTRVNGATKLVIANLMLDKGSYKVPFRVMFVFDKDSLVHAHFATATP